MIPIKYFQDPSTLVRFTLSGYVYKVIDAGGWSDESPRGWECIRRAKHRRRGFGLQYLVEMRADDADELSDYLDSVAGLYETFTVEELGSDRPDRIRAAITSIERVLPPTIPMN